MNSSLFDQYLSLIRDFYRNGSFNRPLANYLKSTFPEDWHECYRIYNAHYNRTKRLKEHIYFMLIFGDLKFITLTFSDSVLDSTSVETRRKYVSRCLSDDFDLYIANIDFGAHTEREHYHAIVKSDSYLCSWQYGFYNVEHFDEGLSDCEKVSRYISKLTNHAIKDSTHNQRLLYSKNFNINGFEDFKASIVSNNLDLYKLRFPDCPNVFASYMKDNSLLFPHVLT